MIYDALDLMRGIEVFLNCVPWDLWWLCGAGCAPLGSPSPQVIGYSDPHANSRGLVLTPNTETTYGTTFLDLAAWGPTVIESPPGSLCVVDDIWSAMCPTWASPAPTRARAAPFSPSVLSC
jgi:hypothetical protein